MNKLDVEVEIYTSDKDLLQLVNQHTHVNLLKTGISDIQRVDLNNFSESFHGLTPNQVTDFKGISGDSSDNLPGINGVGPKTASDLIKRFGSLEGIFDHLNDLTSSQKIKFEMSKNNAIMCKHLSTIQIDIPISLNSHDFLTKPLDRVALKQWTHKYHFNGFDKYFDEKQESFF
jgi:DNA polymerase-1